MNKEQIEDLIKCLESNNKSIELLTDNSPIEQDMRALQITMNNMQITQLQMMLALGKHLF
jgi:CRISPR/Cas system-associated protein endoribonuclease Cas2